ncbi:MAG: transposase, partial [Thermoanaerobaculaceae bacterium]|nr:transposase [Thermoanaerobaculaceae bacterium]
PRDIEGALDADLGTQSLDGHARVLVACFMPDHVHLLLQLDGQGRPLSEYVRTLKRAWTIRLAHPGEAPFWQRTFYDHWMRHDETLEYARYIVANPERKGLVARWQDYPFLRIFIPLL